MLCYGSWKRLFSSSFPCDHKKPNETRLGSFSFLTKKSNLPSPIRSEAKFYVNSQVKIHVFFKGGPRGNAKCFSFS